MSFLGPDDPKVKEFSRDFLRQLAENIKTEHISLADFTREAWKILEPGKPLLWNWHIDLICEYLELVSAGKIQQLLINIPPRYMKSLLVSAIWPAWEWTRYPTMRYLFCCYSQSLSTDLSINRRDIIESEWYRTKWPRVKMKSDQNLKTEFENVQRGKMIATSVGGRATGKGGDRVIIDDLINPEQAYSEKEREKSKLYYNRTLSTRLDNKMLGAFVVIEQRLHVKDFTSLLVKEGGWTHLVIPVENTGKEALEYTFPKSGRVKEMAPGEILWAEREGRDELDKVKKRLGSRSYEAQGLQNPKSEEGSILKRCFWRFYTKLPTRIDPKTGKALLTELIFEDIIQSWDCAFKETSTSDFVVGQVWGRIGADRYLLDQVRERMGITKTMAAIVAMSEKWPRAVRKLIEDKANGSAVMELLKQKVPGLIPINPEKSKIARARAIEPIQESGNIFLPAPEIAPWIESLIDECAEEGDNDDQLDALTQANNYWTVEVAPTLRIL